MGLRNLRMMSTSSGSPPPSEAELAEVPLARDSFILRLVRELTGVLQDVVGIEDARGFVSVAGIGIGEQIDTAYRRALMVDRLSPGQVSAVLVDLKRRIEGDFYIIEETADRIVLGNRACPFGEQVLGRPSLCMMTSNVFGHVAAQNLGYAAVELAETIAEGAPECRVVVYLRPADASGRDVREYFER